MQLIAPIWRPVAALALITAMPLGALAGPASYACNIVQSWQLVEDGTLKPVPKSNLWLPGMGFGVNRRSGALSSKELPIPFPALRVLSPGSAEHYFLAQAESPQPTAHTLILRIDDFRAGEYKPFLLYYGTSVVSGTCK